MDIEITQGLIITANELSHDSGKKYSHRRYQVVLCRCKETYRWTTKLYM